GGYYHRQHHLFIGCEQQQWVVTLTQHQEVDHGLPGASSNYAAQEAILNTGLVFLNATAVTTDGDGDTRPPVRLWIWAAM
ncbi:hypothetical protein, partial [Legionella pneumophila]|uniref:hypothetical protein n=1 Tax=Legionella pneumophila TaxID=446 RepID=UPI00191BD999